jgi:hypothetical protein
MKKIILFCALYLFATNAFSQKETFDLTTYTTPKGWKKQSAESAVQFTKEDAAKGTYCLITLYKSVPGTANAKENFDLAWASLVKEMVTVSTAPEMQPAAIENDWETLSGYAPFENDGNKGVVVLVTASSVGKMVNLIILTNSDVYESEMTSFIGSISLKKAVGKQTPQQTITPKEETNTIVSNGYKFTTTNFDDGWTSTVKEEWVEATKGRIKVLIHYPTEKIDRSSMDHKTIGANAWNILVAPRYSSMKNHVNSYISGYDSPYFLCGEMTTQNGGETAFVTLYKKSWTDWIEIITDSKESFVKTFGVDINALGTYPSSEVFKLLENLNGLNKFAVAASDLPGKWSNSWSGSTYYANVYTGMSAGMSTSAAGQTYEIAKNNTYKWNIVVTQSYGGATNFQNAKSNGTLKMANNWQIHFSDMEGKPKTYTAQFSCIKGGRILWIDGTAFVKQE